MENSFSKILWDFTIMADRPIRHNRPAIVVVDKATNKGYFIDVIILGDVCVKTRLLSADVEKIPIINISILFYSVCK